ncbi:Protein dopey-1 [Chionoecetes opilio]|uniref:Protein dopey-1 n=1 Tax=Chionoecetes opilio TaxID=41210 RepID=A0A8J5CFL8_CHIOP|nr:Protein dopey-1 [Chionoecetes opilio]
MAILATTPATRLKGVINRPLKGTRPPPPRALVSPVALLATTPTRALEACVARSPGRRGPPLRRPPQPAHLHGTHFSMRGKAFTPAEWRGGLLWNGCVQQQALVEMMSLRCLPLHTLVATVRQVVKQPPIVEGSQQILPLEVCVLQVFYVYAQQCPGSQLGECWVALLSMEVSSKLLESCSNIAGSGLGPTTWLRRNLTVKAEHQEKKMRQCTVWRPECAGGAGWRSLDVLYVSEKDKVVPLLTNIMAHVVPYLCNHMRSNMPAFAACSQLLSSLSGYQYTVRVWRFDVLDLLQDTHTFMMLPPCLTY